MGVKKNFGYNLILTFCNYLFPLLTYPYVSRVLGVTNIGICNFVDSIINYFILFSMLGVGSYGVREIARCKENVEKRNEVFSSLFIINTIMTIVSIIVLLLCTFLIPQMTAYKDFIGVGLLKVLFNLFLIEWFFQGIQQFKYITIRSVIVRCIYVFSVFLFVKTQQDTLIYYISIPFRIFAGIMSGESLIDVLPVCGSLVEGYSLTRDKKIVVIGGIITYSIWAIYDFSFMSYVGMIFDLIIVFSNIGILFREYIFNNLVE